MSNINERPEHAPSPAGASVDASQESKPTETSENSAAGDGCRDSPCSLIFSLLEHLMAELDGALCPTGYARCRERIENRTRDKGTKWEGHRTYRLDFGHFYIDILSDGQDPNPQVFVVADEHCTPDEFLGKLNEGINTRHRPHVGTVSARLDFTKYARSIREGFIGFGEDKPSAGDTDPLVGINKLVDSE